ncbi:hypothetical protein HPB48_000585 [Haemaphysalis longicornis]|uniref:Uncharacterized protein n=1 Tax=Haemaphysalis longicornis TaxID=44386 RepID=A0A9J6H679_HAELO|nr:hypothetical protein HPB48_000585 [Haemaphysalis longicornis]
MSEKPNCGACHTDEVTVSRLLCCAEELVSLRESEEKLKQQQLEATRPPNPRAEGGQCGDRVDAPAAGGPSGPGSEPALRANATRSGGYAHPARGDPE